MNRSIVNRGIRKVKLLHPRIGELFSAWRSVAFCWLCISYSVSCLSLLGDEKRLPVAEIADPVGLDKVPDRPSETRGHFVDARFPLTEIDDRQLRLRIERILDRHQGNGRPIIVVRFQVKNAIDAADRTNLGRGTEFERSLSLARWLVGPVGVRARTVAYLPESLEGHAVLVALACEEIAMAPLAELGRASIDEAMLDPLIIDGYLSIAERRGAVPPDAVRSMLDREASLYKVDSDEGKTSFLSSTSLEEVRQKGRLISETQLSIPGQLGKFTGQEMRTWRWITHVARDEDQLREILNATSWEKSKANIDRGDIKPALIEIRGAVNAGSVGRWMRAIDEARNQDAANFLLLHIHSPGGDLAESLRLAEFLANLDETLLETVAWVDGEARGDAALIGLACDSLVMKPNAILGGPGEATIDVDTIRNLGSTWQQLSQVTNRTEGEIYGLLCPDLSLQEFKNARGRVEFGDEAIFSKRADFQDWKIVRPIAFPAGMTAEQAEQRNVAAAVVPNLLAVGQQHGIDKLPPPKRVSKLEQWIRSIADQDWLATLLLTASLMLFTNELTTPGLGVAGFLAFLCIALFFWMRFLNGTVEWLEITLCIAGLLALGLEVFVLPGFGVFGFGGLIMLACGIILASQTFILPSNEYQWKKLATSSGQIAIACIGLMTTIFLLRNQLEKLPFFRLLKLEPPRVTMAEPATENWNYLIGATGITTSRCAPFGKALFGDAYFDVHSQDELLEPETAVEVTEVRDRTILVRRVPT